MPTGVEEKRRLGRRSKLLWCGVVLGLVIAVAPLGAAFIGHEINNRELMNYHWFVFITAPVGLLVSGAALLLAIISTIFDFKDEGG